jgi:hypothetical protein
VHASLKSDSTGSLGDISTTSTRKTYGTNVPEGQCSKGSLSIRSENSENSTNIDYTNIPSTVTWLESIPHDLSQNDDNEATSADNILADIQIMPLSLSTTSNVNSNVSVDTSPLLYSLSITSFTRTSCFKIHTRHLGSGVDLENSVFFLL